MDLDAMLRDARLFGVKYPGGYSTELLGDHVRALVSRVRELEADLAHLRSDAGRDSCADYVMRNRELQAFLKALYDDRKTRKWLAMEHWVTLDRLVERKP
jgi:hypothetical protein